MTTAIKIEGLSKKYIIGHKRQERYTALRDVMMHKLRGVGERLRHPLSLNREEIDIEEFWALKDINLEIKQGDRVGIIGRNGAGKSTLLKILSRITEPTSGKIHINGRIASLLEVGTGFHPELSGRENIYLNGAILGMRREEIKRKFDEIVDFSGVEKFLDTPVKRYSSGMYVRLAFAVAAHLEPEILILDEVLAVGDSQFQKKCLGKMGEAGKEGKTVIFVSHSMGMVEALCSRAVFLSKGNLIATGTTQEIIDHYLSQVASENNQAFMSTEEESADIYFKKIQALRGSGELTNVFPHNEPIRISIRCVINLWIVDSVMGFFIVDQRGRKIFTSNNETWSTINGEEKFVDMIVTIPPNFLVPGQYYFSFVISVPHIRTVCSVEDALSVNVIDAGTIYASYEGYDYGCVFADCDWKMNNEQTQEIVSG